MEGEGVQHNLGMAMVGTLECYEREVSVEVRGEEDEKSCK